MSDVPPTRDEGILDLFDSTVADEDAPGAARDVPADPTAAQRRRRSLVVLAWLLAVLLLASAAVAGWYLTTRKPLSQLPGVNVVAAPTYKTAFHGVEKPLGVAVTPEGDRVFVSQGGATPGVVMLDREGRKLRDLEFPGADQYHVPVYLSVAPDGNLYVGDRAAGAVYLFSRDGAYLSTFTPKDASVTFSPLGVAVAPDGTVYIADVLANQPARHRILVFDRDGALTRTLGEGKLNYPNQLLVGAGGLLYATDSNNARLVVFDADGQPTMLVGPGAGDGDLGLPRGLAIDDRGRIFVADTTDHHVRMYTLGETPTSPPTFVASLGTNGVGDGQFNFPNGVAVDGRARLYVTDRENNRVQVWGF